MTYYKCISEPSILMRNHKTIDGELLVEIKKSRIGLHFIMNVVIINIALSSNILSQKYQATRL